MKKHILHPALLTLLLFACGDRSSRERVEGIQRVMMHDVDEYSFMVSDGAGVARMRKFYANTVTFVRDVAEDKPMWAEHYEDGNDGCSSGSGDILTIHLHGAAEVEGAGWQRRQGKTTVNGATQVIE